MFILLFILSLFSYDECSIEIDSITLAKEKVADTYLYEVEKVFFVEGRLIIDNISYEKAIIKHTIKKLPPKFNYFEYSKIYFGYDNEEQTKDVEPFYCEGREANSYKDIEKILKCTCKHSGFYYWFSPILDKYIKYNSQYNYRLYR